MQKKTLVFLAAPVCQKQDKGNVFVLLNNETNEAFSISL